LKTFQITFSLMIDPCSQKGSRRSINSQNNLGFQWFHRDHLRDISLLCNRNVGESLVSDSDSLLIKPSLSILSEIGLETAVDGCLPWSRSHLRAWRRFHDPIEDRCRLWSWWIGSKEKVHVGLIGPSLFNWLVGWG
jgi:hypothetical protein